MESKTKYKNGKLKVKDPDNIKFKYDDLKDDVIDSKALKKYARSKIGFKDSTERAYVAHLTTYCYFLQEPIEQLINRYKKNQKELSDDETEEDLDVFFDLTDYANHAVANKQAKKTIQNKVKRIRAVLKKNGVIVPHIDVGLKHYDDSAGYFTRKDLPDKETMKTVIAEAKPKYKALYSFMYVCGAGRAETSNVTVKSFIDGLREFSENSEPREIIKELDGKVAEKKVIPLIRMVRQKTGKPYYTCITPECVQFIIDYIKTKLTLLDDLDGKLFKVEPVSISANFQMVNMEHSWGKRGRNNFFSPHRLRHSHFTLIDNPPLANALEGRVNVADKNQQTYDHNLDDPEYLRKKYIDLLPKFEIFDHYDVVLKDEEVQRLQEENNELREKVAKLEEGMKTLGQKITSERANIPFHKVNNVITNYLIGIQEDSGDVDRNRASLLQMMVYNHVKENPAEFRDDEEYLFKLVQKFDIQIELSSKDIAEQKEELAKQINYDDVSPYFIFLIQHLLKILDDDEGIRKRVGHIDMNKWDYVAENYLIESGISPDLSEEDLANIEDTKKLAGEVLIKYLETE